ncbi:MAG: hypothetical protein RL661_297 [Pseudomonadota bacterium]
MSPCLSAFRIAPGKEAPTRTPLVWPTDHSPTTPGHTGMPLTMKSMVGPEKCSIYAELLAQSQQRPSTHHSFRKLHFRFESVKNINASEDDPLPMRILLAEDDPHLGPGLKRDLTQRGFVVDLAEDGVSSEFMGATESYDLIILDLGLPKMTGLEVLSAWRSAGNAVPVLILTAKDAWHEKVDGFKAGADDYLGKPFFIDELLARINAILKRTHGLAPKDLTVDGLRLDENRQVVEIDGQRQESLTSTEFRLLRIFMLSPGKLLSKSHLIGHIYSADVDPESNILEVYIKRLRKKVGAQRIQTRRGQGYILQEKPE